MIHILAPLGKFTALERFIWHPQREYSYLKEIQSFVFVTWGVTQHLFQKHFHRKPAHIASDCSELWDWQSFLITARWLSQSVG